MRGIYHLVADGLAQTPACSKLHSVREVVIWQAWSSELARDWLGLELGPPPPLPPYVREVLETAAPLLKSRRD